MQDSSLPPTKERGVIAQEVQQVMPHAVETLGEVRLQDGSTIPNLLVVNERVLLFETMGATKELGKKIELEDQAVQHLGTKITQIEAG
jgi:hypothetical protein